VEDLVTPASPGGFWHGKTVFVTGASGFIGRHLSNELLRHGATVIAWSRGARRSPAPSQVAGGGLQWICGELSDVGALAEIFEKVDVVFHLAAAPLQGGSSADVPTRANVDATTHLVEAAQDASRLSAFVLASTDRVYAPWTPMPRAETADVDPLGAYAASKAAAEEIVVGSCRGRRLRGIVLRLGNVYGPGDPHPSRLVPSLMSALAAGRSPRLHSDGSAQRDFLFVSDAVSAFLAAGDQAIRSEHIGEIYNVGSGKPVTTLELAELALLVAGRRDLHVALDGATRDSSSWLDCTKIERALGWSPVVQLRDGLQRTWDAAVHSNHPPEEPVSTR
jgi:nucleoside-diphosphate-sugar epimerase